MNPETRHPTEGPSGSDTLPIHSLAKPTLRLVRAGLAAWVLLPPLLWAIASSAADPALAAAAPWHGMGVVLVATISVASALALWALLLQRPMHELRQADRRVRTLAHRDALTGLPNRDGLRLALAHATARGRGNPSAVGLLLLDVDRFRQVNNSLGPAAGDALLRSVAGRIRAVVRDGDVVARLGADQFVVMIGGAPGLPALSAIARNLQRAIAPAHRIGGHDTVVTLSIGVVIQGQGADTADALLECADSAMRAAKAAGGARFCCFEAAMQADDRKHLDLERRLRLALRNAEFVLVYQPIMDAQGKCIVAVEALIRWAEPGRGMVSPADFIPVLEQTGLIVDVGTWVLREACRKGRSWVNDANADGEIKCAARNLVLSVNVSPRQFAEARFASTVATVLAETGFPAHLLQLEVTEGLLLDPSPQTLAKIDALVSSGVRLAIDDFGMGYSSLAYLKTFALHTLKIDRMFVRDVALHARDAAIARAIIDLGHGLGLKVTAEGVETSAQHQTLRELGCDSLQGFFFSRPVGADEFAALLARHGAQGAAAALSA
jgi:diguanylate cyclase (GGDEF)-like protein